MFLGKMVGVGLCQDSCRATVDTVCSYREQRGKEMTWGLRRKQARW
jgi:hypothetical protein